MKKETDKRDIKPTIEDTAEQLAPILIEHASYNSLMKENKKSYPKWYK